jgi:hypothetical protein
VGLEPIEEDRGPGKRTRVYVQGIDQPVIASRSEGAILRDLVETPQEIINIREQREFLVDILDTIKEIDPMLRSIVLTQGKWDLNKLEEGIINVLALDESTL